ncbi:MAG: ATP-grasp domain-containing protein [Thermoplasmata archaeon]|nr:ATP-grasp domain-containing protein [Thermoplasmata archaeon]
MRTCWIVYAREDLDANRFFAERLAEGAGENGMDARIVLADSLPDGVPDLAVNRSRDWGLGRRLEDAGAVVSNPPEVSRICNDKLLTYRLAEDLGIPFLPVSVPGEPLPPGPPWVVKPRGGHGGEGVRLARCEGDLDPSEHDVIQSMAGDPGRDMRVYVLGGKVLAAVMRSNDGDFRANVKQGGSAELCGVPPDAAEAVEKICARLGPDLVGIDFVFSGGKAFLNEAEDAVGTRSLYSLTDLDPARLLLGHLHSKMSL